MIQKKFRLSVGTGAFVLREGIPGHPAVLPGSAAFQAGIHEADVIVALNNTPITEKTVIEDILENIPIGTKIPVTVLREGAEKTLEMMTQEKV